MHYPLTEYNLKRMQALHAIEQQHLYYVDLLEAFKRGQHADIYIQMLPIAKMQYNNNPTIAQYQKECYDEFMRLNATLYNAPKTVLMEYPLFNASEYSHLYALRQLCNERYKKHRRVTAATLCL